MQTALYDWLILKVAREGPISFHDYMQACVTGPVHGYYTARTAIGQGGDFITAPEISQIFGELIGLWAGEVWRLMGMPPEIQLIELGPGRGTLMADALRALRVLPRFLDAARVALVECSPPLRERQAAVLKDAPCPVAWYDTLGDVPHGPAIVIANEFFDALPVRSFIFDAGERVWRQRYVDAHNGAFISAAGPACAMELQQGHIPEDGDIFEYSPGAQATIEAMSVRGGSDLFAALIVDYGYILPSFGDTVQGVRGHSFAGIFDRPGETDLTAHVDFASLKRHAANAGLQTHGPMPMGEWLLRMGIETRLNKLLATAQQSEAGYLISGVRRLIDPAQMGVLFKVLVLQGGGYPAPPPFETTGK